MAESVGWRDLTPELSQALIGKRIVAMRGDGKLYVGTAAQSHPAYLRLENGNQLLDLVHATNRYLVLELEAPPTWNPKLADPRLL